jgi:hypothetical protein
MANEWHYTLNGQQAATPVSAAQLKQLAVSGQLKPTDLVWQDGMFDWVPAGSIKGLFPGLKGLGDSAVVPPGRKSTPPAPPRDWGDMSPVAVFLLTVLTGGLFGLFYAYKICSGFAARTSARKMDAAGRTLGRVRHPLGVLLLSYLTLGFYFYYWAYCVLRECGAYTGRKEPNPRTELSLMLIFPPYAVYVVVFELPDMIRRTQTLAGAPEAMGLRLAVFFLNPCLLWAVPILGMLYQEALNQIWLTVP